MMLCFYNFYRQLFSVSSFFLSDVSLVYLTEKKAVPGYIMLLL